MICLILKRKMENYTATLRRGSAYRLFSLQLGPRWLGPNALPPYLRALFAIFAARINNDKKNAEVLLDQLSSSAGSGTLNFLGVTELLNKYIEF